MNQRLAVIDLGSNTTRMIVVGYVPHHSFRLLDEVRENVRLVHGVDEHGTLQPDPMDRAVATMKLFKSLCEGTGVTQIVPAATSAVREAPNQTLLLRRIEREAGLAMRVLNAREEAYYGYLGVANSLNVSDAFVIDIGGGSTQVTLMRARGFVRSFSQPVGALRFSERFVRTDPISNKEFRALETAINERFTGLDWLQNAGNTALTGIGGTIRSLAELDQKLRNYPMDRVHAYVLRLQRLEELIEMLRGMNQRQREDLPGISRDRADLILTGAVILRSLLVKGHFETLMVSGQGLREGLFYEQFLIGEQPPIFPDLRNFSIQNLARNYHYEAIHAAKVRELALAMFDQLRSLHGYGEWERELLGYASIVHDVGLAVNYYDHHKHSAYLVLNASLSGFSHREIAILALLARYHRKGDVHVDEFADILEPGDDLRVARLSALLRLAEFMERRKHQIVQGLHVEIGEQVRITLRTTGDAGVEIWNANRGAGIFRKAFGKELVVV